MGSDPAGMVRWPMNIRRFAAVILKALGIYWLMNAALYLVRAILMSLDATRNLPVAFIRAELINSIVISVLYASVSYILIRRTDSVLNLMRLDADEDKAGSSESTHYVDSALSVLGTYFLVVALSSIVPILFKYWALQQSVLTAGVAQDIYVEKSWTIMLEKAILFTSGIVLIVGRSRIARLWERLRPLANRGE